MKAYLLFVLIDCPGTLNLHDETMTQMWGDKDLKKDRAVSLAKEVIEKL